VHSGDEVVLRSVLRNKEPEPEMTMSLLFFKRGPTLSAGVSNKRTKISKKLGTGGSQL
jgi:hypothetical protein